MTRAMGAPADPLVQLCLPSGRCFEVPASTNSRVGDLKVLAERLLEEPAARKPPVSASNQLKSLEKGNKMMGNRGFRLLGAHRGRPRRA